MSGGREDGKVLLLRTCGEGGKSYGGFVWPLEVGATVEAPDWDSEPKCGNGLHGLLWGCGNGDLVDADAPNWLVVEAHEADVVDLQGKVKVPRCRVVFVGDREGATAYLLQNGAQGMLVVFATATAGDGGTATAGYQGTATAGERGIVQVRWWDGERYRVAVGYVGEDGIEPGVAYGVRDGKLVVIGKTQSEGDADAAQGPAGEAQSQLAAGEADSEARP